MNNIQVRENKTGIDLILAAPGIRAFNVYLSFRTAFEELGLDLNELTVQRGGDTVARLEARLENDELQSFSLTQENTALSFSGSEAGKFARITVWCAEGWHQRMRDQMLKRTLGLPQFLMAYELVLRHWYDQNLDDAKERRRLGFVCEEHKVTCDGAPSPVTRWTYDLTGKPGLKREHQEYVEVPAAHMWLSERFWNATGARKSDVLQARWLKIRELDHGILYVEAWPELFTSEQGEQGLVQKKLRALLFPSDANQQEKALLRS